MLACSSRAAPAATRPQARAAVAAPPPAAGRPRAPLAPRRLRPAHATPPPPGGDWQPGVSSKDTPGPAEDRPIQNLEPTLVTWSYGKTRDPGLLPFYAFLFLIPLALMLLPLISPPAPRG